MPEPLGLVNALAQQQVDVLQQERRAILWRDLALRPAGYDVRGLGEQPRVAQDAAPDKHARQSRPPQRRDNVLGLEQVAAPVHRNRNGVGYPLDQIPVGAAAVRLRGGAAMHRHRRRAGQLHQPRHHRRVDVILVPPGAHLHGHGNPDGLRHRRHDGRGQLGLAHQAAPGIVPGDLGHGTAHVDVHVVGAQALDDPRGPRHVVGVAAEDLHGNRTLFFGVLGVLEGAIDASGHRLRADHLGDDKAAPALALHQAAKRGVGHARHGRENER